MDLKDRLAIVTGAGSGIGRDTALELSRHGCTCVLVGRTDGKLGPVLDRVRDHAPESMLEACDVSDQAQVNHTVRAVQDRYGHVDILVNNAGIMVVKPFVDLSDEEFDRHMAVNYGGAVHFTRAALPMMLERGQGVIVNVASVGGRLNLPGLTANTASKAALYAFSEALYYELKGKGIHVAVILPGGTATGLFEDVSTRLGQYYRDQSTMSSARVAAKIRGAIENERFETVVPLSNRVHIALHDLLPALFRKLIQRRLRSYVE